MRQTLKLVLCSLLLAAPLAAQIEPSPLFTSASVQQAPRTLYFALSPEQLAGRRVLAFEVLLNGQPQLRETLFLDTASDTGNAFAFLAARTDLRVRLDQLAADRSNRLAVQVSLDGQVIRKFASFQGFVRYNRQIEGHGVSPRQVASAVLDLTGNGEGRDDRTAKGMQPSPECLQQCSDNYNYCTVNDGGCASFGECDRCQNDYNHCVGFCPIVCVEPKSVTNSYSVQNWNGPTNTGNQGCYIESGTVGHYYYQTQMERKHTHVQTTTYCNGTTATSTNVSYSYAYCWQPTTINCYYPTLWSVPCGF